MKESRTGIILLLKYWHILLLVVKYLCPWIPKWIYPSPPLGPGTVRCHDPETVRLIPCTVRCLWDHVLPLRSASSSVGLVDCISYCWRRQWHPTPVLLPGKSHGWRSLVGCSPWGHWRVRHDWATSLSLFTFMHWRRRWQPTPVFLPAESQGRRSLMGCRLWGRTESDATEVT